MYPTVKNFITTFYNKKSPDGNIHESKLESTNILHYRLHLHLQKQLRYFYPNSKLHVITNDNMSNKKNVYYHKFNFKDSHILKLQMYGLLSEESIYLDSDIILFEKFKEEHLPNQNDFNMYWYITMNLQQFAKIILPVSVNKLYNAGVVYIPRPNKKITDDMLNIHYKYFNDNDLRVTDETSASIYMVLKNIEMTTNDMVNVQKSLCEFDLKKKQSVHYTGFYFEQKMMYFEDFKLSPTYKKLNTPI